MKDVVSTLTGKVFGRELSEEFCKEELKKYSSRGEVWKKDQGLYYACLRKFPHLLINVFGEGRVRGQNWDLERASLEAKNYNRRIDFEKGSQSAYQLCQRNKMLDVVCAHMETNKRRIRCIETGKEFESIRAAAREMGLYASNISAVLRGNLKSTGGYTFEYIEEEE